MGQYLIDNNTISDFLTGNLSEKGMEFMSEVIDQTPIISVITEIEALCWINRNKSKEQVVKDFVSDANILNISPDVVALCVKIRRNRKIKTPDAIIAATAIAHKLTLITSDLDFSGIERLKLINPRLL